MRARTGSTCGSARASIGSRATTATGSCRHPPGDIRAPQVVVATGYENEPFIPDWPGRESSPAGCCTPREYRNPEPFHGRSVLVVGPGCSGMEIAYDLAEGGAAKVWLSVRTPPNIVLRDRPGWAPGRLHRGRAAALPGALRRRVREPRATDGPR